MVTTEPSLPKLRFFKLTTRAQKPYYATTLAAGMDLTAALAEDLPIPAGQHVKVPTGLSVAIPEGFEGQVRPRSGLASKHGITVLNAPGTIDADYRGELCVLLVNLSMSDYTVRSGDRIAQLIIAPVVRAEVVEVLSEAELGETARGGGGFGSTGH
jgi:dUTP pyrophosphatase